jgi:hypothetical protein
MASYTRQSTYTDGDVIQASDSSNEFDQLVNAFHRETGHAHNGTVAEGPVIGLIGDAGLVTPLNKITIDTTNDLIKFFVDVSSSAVEQVRIQDGSIVPVTTNDIDLGTSSLEFKDAYFDGTVTTDAASVGALTVTSSANFSGATVSNLGTVTTVDINGGTIDGTIIGGSTAAAGTFTSLNANGGGALTGTWSDLGTVTTVDLNGGTVDGTVIGGSTPAAGTFTTVTASTVDLNGGAVDGIVIGGSSAAAGTFTTATATTVNATTVDSTNLEVTNVKAKDGTASATIADSTGIMTVASAVLTTADINGGTLDGVTIGASTPAAASFTTANIDGGTLDNVVVGGSTAAAATTTTLTANTNLTIAGTTTVTGILDEDNMASDSNTSLATQQSIKAYVDSQVDSNNELSEVLANGNTTGSNDIAVASGQKITTNTIDETTSGSGVTIDSVLLKDDVVNATDIETASISANDGTVAATIANSTGVITIPSAVLTTADINGGTADNVVIGGATAAAASVTTLNVSTSTTLELDDITSTSDLPVTLGGTGASTAANARTNLDVDQAGTALALAIALG